MPAKEQTRLCIVRTLSGRDYHFALTSSDDPLGYRLQRQSDSLHLIRHDGQSDSLHLIRHDGQAKMVFYKDTVECVRFEEGVEEGRTTPWVDAIM
ncbi:MAG: hypothetical protein V3U35_04275 [Candidatus Neomarinimicrobiota bacterium]